MKNKQFNYDLTRRVKYARNYINKKKKKIDSSFYLITLCHRNRWWPSLCSCPSGMARCPCQLFWSQNLSGQESSCSLSSFLATWMSSVPIALIRMRKMTDHTNGSLRETQRFVLVVLTLENSCSLVLDVVMIYANFVMGRNRLFYFQLLICWIDVTVMYFVY